MKDLGFNKKLEDQLKKNGVIKITNKLPPFTDKEKILFSSFSCKGFEKENGGILVAAVEKEPGKRYLYVCENQADVEEIFKNYTDVKWYTGKL